MQFKGGWDISNCFGNFLMLLRQLLHIYQILTKRKRNWKEITDVASF